MRESERNVMSREAESERCFVAGFQGKEAMEPVSVQSLEAEKTRKWILSWSLLQGIHPAHPGF